MSAPVHPSAIGSNVKAATNPHHDPMPSSETTGTSAGHRVYPPNTDAPTTDSTNGYNAPPGDDPYPEQRHAGAVGYGPNYNQGATFTEKVTGLKEELVGKVTKNPEKAEHGHELRTGELKHRQQEADLNSSFGEPTSQQHGVVTEDHERISGPHATEHAKAHDDVLHRSKHGLDEPEHVHATQRAATVAPEGSSLVEGQKSGTHGHSMKHIG